MKDANGLYYYPNPEDIKSRVYVRQGANGVEFRLWHLEHPSVWERHGWLPQQTLETAAAVYRTQGKEANPMLLYDVAVAKALIQEEERRGGK